MGFTEPCTIRWKSLASVAFIRRNTAWNTFMKLSLRSAIAWLPLGPSLIVPYIQYSRSEVDVSPDVSPGFNHSVSPSASPSVNPSVIFGVIMIIFSIAIFFTSPHLLLSFYRGKFWGTQAWFFGIEGYIPIEVIEKNIFGANLGRLKWSTNGSTLSEHQEASDKSALIGECEGVLPNIPETQPYHALQSTEPKQSGQERLVTLVDTYSMTVTLFRAVKPPVAVMICGSEGGMQRAVLCSYDWRAQTFCRETVLRIKTMVVEQMFRVDRFRFSLINGRSFRAEVEEDAREKRAAGRNVI